MQKVRSICAKALITINRLAIVQCNRNLSYVPTTLETRTLVYAMGPPCAAKVLVKVNVIGRDVSTPKIVLFMKFKCEPYQSWR